jgi:perosamine synthetase
MKLAIHGGEPIRKVLFPAYNPIGEEEKEAVNRVLDSGILSNYIGAWHGLFNGGPENRKLENEWAEYFGVKHAITVNSCTSGLYCAVGATGVEPGEEIIVSPFTMSASATAPLIYNAIPVFADIEEEYFCLDPNSVEERITPRTKAILVVDIFGLPYDADAINAIARKHGLYIIEDCAQAPGATYKGRFAGTLADIGVYSLNYHKHIHCGEGGVVVTNNDALADKVRLIRNHAEAVVGAMGMTDITNMIGFNFRMTEIEAAITRCQLKKLKDLVKRRQENCAYIEKHLKEIPALIPAKIREHCTHAFYTQPFKFNSEIAGISRNAFIDAVRAELQPYETREAEGIILGCGYVKPLYLQPIFQNKIAYGSKGCPFTPPWYTGMVDYSKGICPVTERMHEKELITHELMRPSLSQKDLDDVVTAFYKVWENKHLISRSLT